MTADHLLDALGLLDEALVADAKPRSPASSPSRPRAAVRRRVRRVALLAAAVSLLFSVTAYALGGPGGVFSRALSAGPGRHSLETLPRYERRLGFPVRAVKEFSNGYRFREMALVQSSAQDAEGNPPKEFLGLDLDYCRDGAPEISLTLEPAALSDEKNAPPPTETRAFGAVTVRYCRSAYKFVPEDYRPTVEDSARMAAGELTISYGSDAVEERFVCSAIFCLGDVRYCLLCLDDCSADTLFQMAQELLDA